MSKFNPLGFQLRAIDKLTEGFLILWNNAERQLPMVLKSPTGSGKTFMVAQFLHGLNALPQWDADKCVIWITFSDSLAMQSKDKFRAYFSTNLENNLLTVEDFKQGKLFKNDILFINWDKLVKNEGVKRLLRRPEKTEDYKEQGFYLEDVLENTHQDGREVILIVDESHIKSKTQLAQYVVDIIDPKVILNVSATPKQSVSAEEVEDGRAVFVIVKREDVVAEGLIKEKIAIQTEEDLEKFVGRDEDELLIDLAIDKKKILDLEYKKIGKKINPLILIQLPNDDQRLKEEGRKTKEQTVLDYLLKKGVDLQKSVALWFDGKQVNLELVTENESEIDFMLFKQTAGTGWDCPRAHVLVMFREIKSATFYTQTIGRILRTPEPDQKEDYKNSPILRTGYLFTNYQRNEVGVPDETKNNKPFVFTAYRKSGLSDIPGLHSDVVSRVNYGDLGNAIKFQASFIKSANDFFGIEPNDLIATTREKIAGKGVDLTYGLNHSIMVNAEFNDFDKLILDLPNKGKDKSLSVSKNDVEKLFNFWCFKLLSEQTGVKSRVSNIARSWSPLKSAIRVWFKKNLEDNIRRSIQSLLIGIKNFLTSTFKPSAISNSVESIKSSFPCSISLIFERSPENLSANSCWVKPAFFLEAFTFKPMILNISVCFFNFI